MSYTIFMKITKKDLEKSQVEVTVELSLEEFQPYIKKGIEKISRNVKIDGFRPGKVPFEILKKKVSEMTILEESARFAIDKTILKVIDENLDGKPIGQPKVDITKLAPDNPMEYKVVFAMLPKIELGKYKDLEIKAESVEISQKELDGEMEKMLQNLREMRAQEKIVDREVQENDKVIVDIEMFSEKVPLEGGQSKATAVIIGKDYLIPGFDKNLLKAKKNDTRKFKIPYPQDHYQKNLAGKMIDFKVKIKDVYERKLPEIDDSIAKTIGKKSLAELKKDFTSEIKNNKLQKSKSNNGNKILDIITKSTKFGPIPEMLINHEAKSMLSEMEQMITKQGAKFDDYLANIKKTHDQLLLDMLPDAVKRVKSSLLIREIALKENIVASDKEVEEKQKSLLAQYKGYEKVEEKVKETSYKEFLRNSLVNTRVLENLEKWNLKF